MLIADPIQLAKFSVLLLLVAACSATDLVSRRIPNSYLAPALAAAFALQLLGGGLAGLGDGFAGLVFGLAILSPFYVLGGMSAGDVKLMGVTGAILGAHGAIVAGFATLVAGGLLGIVIIGWRLLEPMISEQAMQLMQPRSDDTRHYIQIGRQQPPMNIRKETMPYAPAVAAGAYFAVWQINFLAG